VWILMLDLAHQGWGAKRITNYLNKLGIPSPDAGRIRMDHDVPHYVSGRWNARTVLELLRNSTILGILVYGQRSEGGIRRLGADGPRKLDSRDRTESGGNRMIYNDDSVVIRSETGIPGSYDPVKWEQVQGQLQGRALCQKGIARCKDPAKYPLSTRVIDMTDNCGSVMYGRPSGKRRLYVCSRYLRDGECEYNSVDGEALLRSVLGILRQITTGLGSRRELRKLLQSRATAPVTATLNTAEIEARKLAIRADELRQQCEIAGRRMTIESDNTRYEMIAKEFDRLTQELRLVERSLEGSVLCPAAPLPAAAQVEAGMELFNQISNILGDADARERIRPMLQMLNARIGLNFGPGIKGKKRAVRNLLGGMIAFGDEELPVKLHGRDRVDDGDAASHADDEKEHQSAFSELTGPTNVKRPTSDAHGPNLPGPTNYHRKGISFTKVNRGDRI